MTVRSTAKTTFSIGLFLLAIWIFLKFFPEIMPDIYYYAGAAPYLIGNFYPGLIKASVILILSAALFEAILRKKAAFGLLSPASIIILLIAGGAVYGFSLIDISEYLYPEIIIIILWALFLLVVLIALGRAFKSLIKTHLTLISKYDRVFDKPFKGIYLAIKKIIEIERFHADGRGNLIDRIILYLIALTAAVFTIVAFVSVIVYVVTHWQYVFEHVFYREDAWYEASRRIGL